MEPNIFKYSFIIAFAAITWSCSPTRNIKVDPPLDSIVAKNMILSHAFVFIPRYVNPMSGRRRELSSGFEISLSKDSIISYLPFMGRGYIAPLSPSDIDYDFTSTHFTIDVIPARKGWNISIKPTDQPFLRELYFTLFDNGKGRLNITSLNRSSISYDGYIKSYEGYIKRIKVKEQKN